jgi:hypothetical protein
MQANVVVAAAAAPPPPPSQKAKVYCALCGTGFERLWNLTRHEAVAHANHNTPEAIAKRQLLNEYHNANRRKRRAKDPVYREKQRDVCRTNRSKKTRVVVAEAAATAVAVAVEVAVEVAAHDGDNVAAAVVAVTATATAAAAAAAAAVGGGGGGPVAAVSDKEGGDVVHIIQIPTMHGGGGGTGGGGHTRRSKVDKNSTFQVQTTPLTQEGVTNFFAPKWSLPRSKEQRRAAPRSSDM